MPEAFERDTPVFHWPSQFLTIRVWCEDLGPGRSEWRGRIQNVTSHEVRYFRGWPMLVACLQDMMAGAAQAGCRPPESMPE
jgi:hypothetical protein